MTASKPKTFPASGDLLEVVRNRIEDVLADYGDVTPMPVLAEIDQILTMATIDPTAFVEYQP